MNKQIRDSLVAQFKKYIAHLVVISPAVLALESNPLKLFGAGFNLIEPLKQLANELDLSDDIKQQLNLLDNWYTYQVKQLPLCSTQTIVDTILSLSEASMNLD